MSINSHTKANLPLFLSLKNATKYTLVNKLFFPLFYDWDTLKDYRGQ